MRNPPHSEEDAHRYSSHGQTRRDDRELHEGVAPYAKGGFHPDSSDVPSRRPPADVPHCTIGPVEQSVHAIEHRTRRHRDEKLHRSARRSSSADATAVSQPRRGLEKTPPKSLRASKLNSLKWSSRQHVVKTAQRTTRLNF
ncbi:hypothetical protein BDP27DRAFT_1437440 [Rhodocollybia butyracea]|uniref:Uncharacterized protein n=1 Tax=Rhodocollybia butyracea TaxID=206335 RepID=A0A9P5P672_9AGAR|nr:hypothetical protein BDP27DRAFT_1437440 [Rhodocollybia butyracea]